MSDAPVDPRWPKILSLSVHEFRTPMTVVAGYIRMLLKDRAGPLSDQQRRLLEEAEKSCARLSALLGEVSELSQLEGGTISFTRQPADIARVVTQAAAGLPELPDRTVHVDVSAEEPGPLAADEPRLTAALGAIMTALRREIVTTDRLIVRERRAEGGYEIVVGDEPSVEAIDGRGAAPLPIFDEWRGGCGLSLAVARRVINAHGGSVWSAPDGHKSGARIFLPAA
ncbi:MAG TPA: HAMP domain-containing sensor histidine kinase [Vicinamibacterales bacterium]|nr:HAMP domain-containing sensor histidine kinase [Vicinamibacterales bacterium]